MRCCRELPMLMFLPETRKGMNLPPCRARRPAAPFSKLTTSQRGIVARVNV
jgi:hypothetical protein